MSQVETIVEIVTVPVDEVKPSPYQPRTAFNLDDIRGSIQRDGILIPLTVREKDGYYELVDGERRLRLARELGYKTVPVTVIDVDDTTARRMVWKVNTLRQDYSPKEKTYYFEKLQKRPYEMSPKGIARECDIDVRDVKAYLNVLKLPKEYQQMVWDRVIPIRNVRELDQLFDGVARTTPEENPEIFDLLDRSARERHFSAEQIREALKPYLSRLRELQIEKATRAIETIEPEVKIPKTPEEFEKAARVLRREAERRKTPKQKHQELIEKIQTFLNSFPPLEDAEKLGINIVPYKKKLQEIRDSMKENPEEATDAVRKLRSDFLTEKRTKERERREAIIREKAEAEIRERSLKEAEKKLLKDQDFMERAATEAIKKMQKAPEPIVALPMPPSPEQFEAMRRSMQSVQERTREILEKPEVQEHGRLFRNWLSHEAILNVLESLQCPVCGRDSTNLVWKCHDLSLKDSYEKAHAKYQEAILKQKEK